MAAAGSVREALSSAADALSAAGVDGPRYDAELLLAAALGVDRAALTAGPEAEVSASAGRRFGAMVRRRVAREPVAYILGRKGFRRIELEVDCHCLIPRPETELLVELALEVRPESVADVGTGSGAIALAVADELPAASVIATDTSPDALAIASENADRLGLAARVSFESGTLPTVRAVDLLLANLPYVPELGVGDAAAGDHPLRTTRRLGRRGGRPRPDPLADRVGLAAWRGGGDTRRRRRPRDRDRAGRAGRRSPGGGGIHAHRGQA